MRVGSHRFSAHWMMVTEPSLRLTLSTIPLRIRLISTDSDTVGKCQSGLGQYLHYSLRRIGLAVVFTLMEMVMAGLISIWTSDFGQIWSWVLLSRCSILP